MEREFFMNKIKRSLKKKNVSLNDERFLKEQFRTIKTTIQFIDSNTDTSIRTIAISSANKGEGKSFCALKLARAFSESGKKVLVIDTDMYNPRISTQLMKQNKQGLSNYLMTSGDYYDFIYETYHEDLFLMPSGPLPQNINQLYQTNKMEELLAQLKKEYDIIILDTPPTLLLNDSRIIGNLCDGVIMVVHNRKTTIMDLKQSVDLLSLSNSNVIGTILNRTLYNRKELDGYSNY